MSSFDPKVMRKNNIAVFSMYFAKTVAKGVVGVMVGSAALITDAFHSFSDLVQYGFISWSIKIANRVDVERFPAGRKALENLVAFGVGLSLLYFGIFKCLIPGLHKSINVLGLVEWLETASSISLRLENVSSPSSPMAVVLTLTATAIISYIVYRFEIGNAAILRSQALRSDALELKSDLCVELVVAFGFLAASLWNLGWVDPVAQVLISGFVIYSGWDILKENGLKIQGMALPKSEQQLIRQQLATIEGVLNDDADSGAAGIDVKAYYAGGEQIRAKCTLRVKSTSGQSIRLITSLAESRIKRFMEPIYDNVDVSITCNVIPSEDETDHLIGAIDQYLRTVWGIAVMSTDKVHMLVKHFVTSQFDVALSQALDLKSGNHVTNDKVTLNIELLAKYILAYCHFWLKGTKDSGTEFAFREIEAALKNKDLDLNIMTALRNAVAFYKIERLIDNGQSAGLEISAIRETLQATYGNSLVGSCLRGEVAHLLARSYYKVSGYDLDKARDWFKKARDVTISSGTHYVPLFSDRIWTDWGNLEAQFHHLDEADQYLNQALDLKRLQKDKYGFAIIYGCLANVAARKGELLRAVELYEKDLQLVDELGIEKDKPHVQCKIADVLVKQALIHRDQSQSKEAVSVALAANDGNPGAFFPLKAVFKSQYGVWWLNPEDTEALGKAGKTLDALINSAGESPNLYIRGILNRLRARYIAVTADTKKALNLFTASQKCFTGVDSQTDLPIQACLSNLEAVRWSITTVDVPTWTKKINEKLEELVSIMATSGSVMPEYVSVPDSKEIKKIRKAIGMVSEDDIKNPKAFMKLNKRLEKIDRLIWFLEI